MTLEEFKELHQNDAMLTAEEISELVHTSPDRLREYARLGQLPFASLITGNSVKFPKAALIQWAEGRNYEQQTDHEVMVAVISTLETVLKNQKFVLEMMKEQNELLREATQVAQM